MQTGFIDVRALNRAAYVQVCVVTAQVLTNNQSRLLELVFKRNNGGFVSHRPGSVAALSLSLVSSCLNPHPSEACVCQHVRVSMCVRVRAAGMSGLS